MIRSLRIGLLPIALALAGHLRADEPAPPAPPPDDIPTLRANNKQLSDELAAAWKESEKLKADLAAAQAAAAKNADDNADLQKQVDAAKGPKADAAAPADGDVSRQLAELQDKLTTALRSFTVVQDENAQLTAAIEKANGENASLNQQLESARSNLSSLQVQAAATSQIEPLRSELRNSQNEVGRLALENAQLRDRLSLAAPGMGPPQAGPARSAAMVAPTPAETATAPPPPPPAPPAAKTYVVVEGDTLTRISRKFYGTSGRWEEILDANRPALKDEKSLSVGSTIKIP
jgi:nucleoid-associated protein YgaU